MFAIDGFGGTLEFSPVPVEYETLYNVWIDVENKGLEEGDTYSVYIQENGGDERAIAFEDYTSDRNPAGSVDLGLPGVDLDTLFISSHNGELTAGQFLVDDFYLSNGGFNSTIPSEVGGLTATEEIIDDSTPSGGGGTPGFISGIAVASGEITISFEGNLKSSSSVTGPYEAVQGASGPDYMVNPDQAQQFYIAD
ncbi:MAG: hypothetical protein HOH33_16985 [Verrucomicrobia bacterium]|nr:hypothetical protein [Verrucomicrobiota bacterium]